MKTEEVSNQIFHYTHYIMPKGVTSLGGPSSRYCVRATQLLLKKSCSGGEPLATLCDQPHIWTSDLPLQRRSINALPLDQLADPKKYCLPFSHFGDFNCDSTSSLQLNSQCSLSVVSVESQTMANSTRMCCELISTSVEHKIIFIFW